MSKWKVARERGNQIARILKLRKASEHVHPHQRRIFSKALVDMAKTPNAPVRTRIESLFRQVRRKRELQTALVMLDLAWRIPPESRLEDDVVWMIRRCYLDAPREQWRRTIRDDLRDRQVHPFPNVRRIVWLVRHVDPVDEAEITELADLERGYPDLRQSIAERVIVLNQTEFLEPVIAYLTDVMTRKESHTEEHKAAKKLFSKLAADFRKDEQTLGVLYREYLERYHTKEPRGFLMLALACYGDAIVPQLVLDHAANPLSRGPIEHLLMQMIMRGGVMATDALITFVKDAHSAEASRTTSFLLRGLLTLAGHNHNHSGAIAVRDMVEQHMPALKRRPLPEIQSFLRRYQELEWGEANVDALIDSVVDGTLTDPERQLLRRLASVVSPRLLAVAQDSEKSPDERVRALDALGVLRRAATPQLADSLWTVFSDTDIEDVRVGVVRAFGTLELDPGASARTVLFDLIQKGSPRLAEEIQLAWDRIFTAASLA